MKIILSLFMTASFLFSIDATAVYDTSKLTASKELKGLITKNLSTWVNDPAIVTAVLAANKQNATRTQTDIDALDKKWMAAKSVEDFMKPYLENDCAKFLKTKIAASEGLFAEAFIMDFQGCIVGEVSMTSDFWQGDENKFKLTYPAQAVFIDKIKFDESSKTSSIQISLPVMDKKAGKIIGAMTVTINMEKRNLLKQYGE